MEAPPKVLPPRLALLLGNLRYMNVATILTLPLQLLTKYIMSYFYQVLSHPVSVEKYTPIPTPIDSYQHRTTCQWSDTDVLGHMKNSHYIRMCSDALSAAIHCKSQVIPDHLKVISIYCCMSGMGGGGFKNAETPQHDGVMRE